MAYHKCASIYGTANSAASVQTASGAIANFNTKLAMPLKSLKVDINATQEAGTPTPQSPKAIGGWNEAKLIQNGKNLLKTDGISLVAPSDTTFSYLTKRIFQNDSYCVGLASNNYYNPALITSYEVSNNNVKINSQSQAYGLAIAINLKAGLTYNLSFTTTDGKVTISFYSSDGSWLSNTNEITSSGSFVVPNNAKQSIILFRPTTNDTLATFTNIQIEVGSSASDYEPYNTPITTLINLGGTYYGGYVTQDKNGKRELVVTCAREVFDGVNKLFNGVWGANSNGYAVYGTVNDGKRSNLLKCNKFKYTNIGWSNMPLYSFGGGSGSPTTISFCLPNTITSKDEANAWLRDNNLEIVYELAEPFTIELPDGEPIKTLPGVNNIYADTGDTEVSFKKLT